MRRSTVAGTLKDALFVLSVSEGLGVGCHILARGLGLAVLDVVSRATPLMTTDQMEDAARVLKDELGQEPKFEPSRAIAVDNPAYEQILRKLRLGLRVEALQNTLSYVTRGDLPYGECSTFAAAVLSNDAVGMQSSQDFVTSLIPLIEYLRGHGDFEGKEEAVATLYRLSGGIIRKTGAVSSLAVLASSDLAGMKAMLEGMMAPGNDGDVRDVRSVGRTSWH